MKKSEAIKEIAHEYCLESYNLRDGLTTPEEFAVDLLDRMCRMGMLPPPQKDLSDLYKRQVEFACKWDAE